MGDRLWMSPATGYRRRGTRLVELRAVLGAGITARTVLEPLQSWPSDANAEERARVLSSPSPISAESACYLTS